MTTKPQAAGLLRAPSTFRRVLPFVIATVLLWFVVSQLEFGAVLGHLRRVNLVGFCGFTLAFLLCMLGADAHATAWVYRRLLGPIRWRELVVLRGASYAPSILNQHLGQAWLTYQISRIYGGRLWRTAGATLLSYVIVFGWLVFFAATSLVLDPGRFGWLTPTVAVVLLLGAGYLGVLWLRPTVLVRYQLTAPLIETGVGGHLHAAVHRLPHMLVLLIGAWVPFRFFGVDIPLVDALVCMPLVLVVEALPITPQGVGTRDALAILLFTGYASGTEAERIAAVAASTMSFAVVITLFQTLLSLILLPRAERKASRGVARI